MTTHFERGLGNKILQLTVTAMFMLTMAALAQTNCNRPTAEAITYLELPGQPFAAIPSKDGCWIYVSLANEKGGPPPGVAVLRRTGGKVSLERVLPTESGPAGMVMTPDGKTLVGSLRDRLVFVDVGSGPTTAKVTGYFQLPEFHGALGGRKVDTPGAIYVNVTRDGRFLFVSNEWAASISVIDLKASPRKIIGNIPTGFLPIAVTFSPDERYLYSTAEHAAKEWGWPQECKPEGQDPATAKPEYPSGAVMVIDAELAKTDPAKSVLAKSPAGCSAVRLVLSPEGDRAYVTARNSNALLVFDTGKLLRDPQHALVGTVPVGTSPVGVAVTRDGKKIFTANSNRFAKGNENQTVSMIDAGRVAEGSAAVVRTIPAGAFPRELRITPDGKTLLITNFASRTLELVDLDQ